MYRRIKTLVLVVKKDRFCLLVNAFFVVRVIVVLFFFVVLFVVFAFAFGLLCLFLLGFSVT